MGDLLAQNQVRTAPTSASPSPLRCARSYLIQRETLRSPNRLSRTNSFRVPQVSEAEDLLRNLQQHPLRGPGFSGKPETVSSSRVFGTGFLLAMKASSQPGEPHSSSCPPGQQHHHLERMWNLASRPGEQQAGEWRCGSSGRSGGHCEPCRLNRSPIPASFLVLWFRMLPACHLSRRT